MVHKVGLLNHALHISGCGINRGWVTVPCCCSLALIRGGSGYSETDIRWIGEWKCCCIAFIDSKCKVQSKYAKTYSWFVTIHTVLRYSSNYWAEEVHFELQSLLIVYDAFFLLVATCPDCMKPPTMKISQTKPQLSTYCCNPESSRSQIVTNTELNAYLCLLCSSWRDCLTVPVLILCGSFCTLFDQFFRPLEVISIWISSYVQEN